MGGGKETPRQKMVGLMYLVLMALLAMNVSKSIIAAFITLNDKFESKADLNAQNNEGRYDEFEMKIRTLKFKKASQKEIDDITKLKDQATIVRGWARVLSNFYIEEASSMINAADPSTEVPFYSEVGTEETGVYYALKHLSSISKQDDYDTPTRLFVGGDHHHIEPRGTTLIDSLKGYRDRLISYLATYENPKTKTNWTWDPAAVLPLKSPADTAEYLKSLEESFKTVNPDDIPAFRQIYKVLTNPETMENHHEIYPYVAVQFDHMPVVAAACNFTSWKGDVLQAEGIALTVLHSRAKVEMFNFNKIEALAFGTTAYINQGDSLDMNVMIAAYDSTEEMKLRYWIDDSTKNEATMKEFAGVAGQKLSLGGSAGAHYVVGEIAVKEKGAVKWKPWKFHYSVGQPNAAVAAADLAVLYRGWKNRIKVSASGYDPSSVTVSCSNCKISGSPDKDGYYIAEATAGKEAFISVSAKGDNGKNVELTKERFRIFPLPQPQPYFGGQTFDQLTIKKSTAQQVPKIIAKLGDSPLDVPYEITEFSMLFTKNGKAVELSSKSGSLTSDMKAAIAGMAPGMTLSFVGIKAAGPSGKSNPIPGLSFKLI